MSEIEKGNETDEVVDLDGKMDEVVRVDTMEELDADADPDPKAGDYKAEVEVNQGDLDEPWRKYHEFFLEVDPDQDYKAKEFKLCSFARPHMRAFHCCWVAFFNAFFMWFAITPLLSEIQITLNLTKEEVWTSNIVSSCGTIVALFTLGPLCDKFGARILFTGVLCAASIPLGLVGLVNSAAGLAVLRVFIGISGACFVMSQYWASRMFTKNIVGTANAVVAGWGNVGAGMAQLVMGSALFPLFKIFFQNYPNPAELAWRTVCVVPAVVAVATALIVNFISDDAPTGNYKELKQRGSMPDVSAAASLRTGACNFNTWILFVHYGCSLGVVVIMNNTAGLYFRDQFGLGTESAAALASIFGWMSFVARGLGGYASDKANAKVGMRGRLAVHSLVLLVEGLLVFVFASAKSLGVAIAVMVFLALFVQAATGTTYSIVPYVDPPSTGAIAGIVGAGGSTFAVCFGLAFRQLLYKDAFFLMGSTILVSSVMPGFIFIKGQSSLFCSGGTQAMTVEKANQTLIAPERKKDDMLDTDC